MTYCINVRLCGVFLLLATFTGREAEALKSGPAKGQDIEEGSFGAYNLNGKRKGSYHCLVCEYALDPVVLVFAKEPVKDKDQALTALIKKLDKAVEKYSKQDLRAFVVFLSPDANSSANDARERAFWGVYMDAYESAFDHTSSDAAPWYIIPADHKWFTRLVVVAAIVQAVEALDLSYPRVSREKLKELRAVRKRLERER